MDKSWDSLTPRELRNAKIISVAFLIISILIFAFLSKIVGVIMLFLWIISGSGPFVLLKWGQERFCVKMGSGAFLNHF